MVSFVVNKVDHDPTNAVNGDIHRQFFLGDYGCFVDSLRTRIMQLGIQNIGSPDLLRSHRLGEEYSIFSVV